MGQLILIAGVSIGLAVTQFAEFLQKVGVELPAPISEEMFYHTVIRTNDGLISTRVIGRFYVNYFAGKVRVFTDRDENVAGILTRLEPQEMTELSRKPCLIDEEQARQIACDTFYRLGHQDRDFDPPEVHRFTYQPDEFSPEILTLPYFHVQWDLTGEHHGNIADPCVQMYVSGQSKRIVYYSIASLARVNR